MSVQTFLGTIENGQVRLADGILLPERTTVYVVVPDVETPTEPRATRKKVDLAELVSRMPSDYQVHEEDFGKLTGKEEW